LKFSLKKIGSRLTGAGKGTWEREKKKASGVIYALGKNPFGKQMIRQEMNRQWYRHIDKALLGNSTKRDEKHWKRMLRTLKKEVVGEPSHDTLDIIEWITGFQKRVKQEAITKDDLEVWLPHFREYMELQERDATENFIIKEKLVEDD